MRQIIAIGGRGFSTGTENLSLEKYILGQTSKQNPKVCFLPTASGDAESYILNFYKTFTTLDCQPSYLSLFDIPTRDLESFLLEKDIIYVGGGNTRSMLALWREWELDKYLFKAYQNGTVLSGTSAGANCWFEQCSTDALPGDYQVLSGLGYLRGSFCPHYDGEPTRRPSFQEMVRQGEIKDGMAADDGAVLHFIDEQLARVMSFSPEAKTYRVFKVNGEAREEAVNADYVA